MASASVPTPFVEREMDVDALRRSLQEAVAALGDRRVAAVGIGGMAESGAPLDAAGRALAPVIAWHDGRGEEVAARLDDRFGPALHLRIGQRVRPVLTVVKLGWLVDNGLTGMVRWLGVPELVLHALTGAEATEFSLAARTGCYDVGARQWMPEVAEALGFSVDVFPPVRAGGDVMGLMWDGIPVTIAGHDHLVGMAGAGVGPAEMANSVGTAETLVVRTPVLPDAAAALEQRVRITVHPGGDGWAALFGAARAGLVLTSAAHILGRSPAELDRLAADAEPVDVADALDPLASGQPTAFPDAPPGRIWAGVLQALTARTADGYERLASVVGPRERVVVFGGGSVSQPWLRAKAAALPVPVVRATVRSAVARGAALYAGVAAGWWASVADAPTPPPSAD